MKEILNYLNDFNTLSHSEAKDVLIDISEEKYNPAQVAAFMSSYLMRSITVEELSGFRSALLELSRPTGISPENKIDMCGTGGDGKNTFNISTLSAVVASACGIQVSKHGNYGVSSACGSSNVLEAIGYKFQSEPDALNKELDACNICFLHAPLFHPAMKSVAPIRKQLAVKTFFNMLGPIVNPVVPQFQSVGVFSLKLQRLYNYIFQEGDQRYAIMHDLPGYDEVSLTGICKLVTSKGESLVSASDFNCPTYQADDIFGGNTIEDAKTIFLNLINNKAPNAHVDVVCANTAIALKLFKPESAYSDLFLEAKEAIESGKVKRNFDELLRINAKH